MKQHSKTRDSNKWMLSMLLGVAGYIGAIFSAFLLLFAFGMWWRSEFCVLGGFISYVVLYVTISATLIFIGSKGMEKYE